ICLLALMLVPMLVLRSIAIGGVAVVGSALAGALVLLPALLAWLGPNVNRGAIGRAPEQIAPSPFWRRVGELSMRHPIATALGCAALLLLLATPALRMKGAMPDSRALPAGADARTIDEALSDPARFHPGAASSIPVVVRTPGPVLAPENLRAVRAFVDRIAALPGVVGVGSAFAELDPALPAAEFGRRLAEEPSASLVQRTVDGDTALLVVRHDNAWRSPEAEALVAAIRALPHRGLERGVGGATAQTADQGAALRRYGTLAVAAIAVTSFVILFLSFRSIAVPLKAIAMNVLSLGASYGLLVWVFQDGHGVR